LDVIQTTNPRFKRSQGLLLRRLHLQGFEFQVDALEPG
jgi:hypothetical protein